MRKVIGLGRLPGMNGEPLLSADADAGLLLGGRYRLERPIGAGGMAVVWAAHDDVLARTVAVKVLAASDADDPRSRDRIRQEARAAAALSHPNIAQVHDYGETATEGGVVPYVVMELVSGGTLQQRVSTGPVPPAFAMRVCAEVGAALAAAHAEAIVHRDVKPANVMLAPTGAKVVDFGIAAAIAPGRRDETDFEVLGTPAYLAPERLLDDVVEPASDVYALGVVLYQLLSGHSPWSAESTTQMLTAHVYHDPEPLPAVPGVPDYVTALCNRCLNKDPSMRPSARETAALLAQGAQLRVVSADQAPPPGGLAADLEPSVVLPTSPAPAGARPASPPASGAAVVSGTATGHRPSRVRRWALAVPLVATIAAAGWALAPHGQVAAPSFTPTGVPSPVPSEPGGAATGSPVPGSSGTPTATVTVRPSGAAPPAPLGGAVQPGAAQPGPAQPGATQPGATQPGATQPGGTGAPTPSPPPATTPSPAGSRTLSSVAGSVVATCPSADTAQILSWSPTSPYKVKSADGNAGPAPAVVFKHGASRVTMTVTCESSVPSAAVAGP